MTANKKASSPCLFSNSACAYETKKTFCEAESVIKSCLKILDNLPHGGKHAVDKAEQIPLLSDKINI